MIENENKKDQSSKEKNNEVESSSLKRIGNFIREARLSRDQSIDELASTLKNDPKEIAEHLMLIDLGRNDVG